MFRARQSFLTLWILAFGSTAVAWAGTAQWEFNGSLSSSTGQVDLVGVGYPGVGGAPGVTYEGSMINGEPAQVARLTDGTALVVYHGFPSNGGGGYLNQYTIIMDIKVPVIDWTSLYQTNEAYDDVNMQFDLSAAESNDGDWFIRPNADGGGIGIEGNYGGGALLADTWYRFALVVDLVAGTYTSYINGAQVQQNTGRGLDGRFALYTSDDPDPYDWFLLFADETGVSEMGEIVINSFQFRDVAVSAVDIAALGGPTPLGIGIAPADCDMAFFSDDFNGYADDAAVDAAGYQRVDVNAPVENATWTITNPGVRRNPPTANGAPSSGKFLISDSDAAGGNNVAGSGMSHDLITPSFSTAGGASVWLHVDLSAQLNNGDDAVFDLDVSTDDGTTWTNALRRIAPGRTLAPVTDNTNADGFFGRLDLDLSSLAANEVSVRLRFRHFEPTDAWWIAIDDLVVDCNTAPQVGACVVLSEDFSGGLGAMAAVSRAAVPNGGTETWHTTDKGNRYVAGAVGNEGVNRINQPNPLKEFAIMESQADPDPVEDEYLVTPTFNLTNFTEVVLHYRSETIVDDQTTQEVLLSLDGGATYPVTIFSYNKIGATASAGLFDPREEPFYAQRAFKVPQAAGQARVVFAFHFQSAGNRRYWALDDITVSGTTSNCDLRDCALRAFAATYDPGTNTVSGSWSLLNGDAGFRVLEGARVIADNLPANATSFTDTAPPAGGVGVVYTLETFVSSTHDLVFDYCYDANAGQAAYVATFNNIGCLDGTWRRGNNSDQWDGSSSVPGMGAPGGIDIDVLPGQAEGGGAASVLALEDVGDPRSGTPQTPGSFPDPGNRKLYLWRDTSSELDLATGVTLKARWRLNPAPRALEFANNGGALPVPNGSTLHDPNKGQIGFIQRAVGAGTVTDGFSFAITDAGLLEFGTNGACTAGVSPQCFDIDETTWVTVWLAVKEETGGSRVKLYLNNNPAPVIDQVIMALEPGADDATLPEGGGAARSLLAIAIGSTGQNAAIQVDYLCAASGFYAPGEMVVELVNDKDCPSAGVATFACPRDLSCRANQTAKSVSLSWTPGVNHDATGYEIRRNGVAIASVGLGASSHTDSPPPIRTDQLNAYEYELVVAGNDGADCAPLGCTAVVSPGRICFADDFEGYANDVDFELAGYFLVDEVPTPPGENATWTVTNPGGRANPPIFDGRRSTGRFAISDSDFADGADPTGSGNSNDLWSPSFSTLGKTQVWLHMDTSAQLNNNGKVVFDVDVSTDGGATWTNRYRAVAPSRTEAPPVADTTNADGFFGRLEVNISSIANQPDVRFRLRSFEPNDDWWVAVDNIIVDDVPVLGGADTLFMEGFSAGSGGMSVVSLAGNTGTETWTTTDKCSPPRSIVTAGGTFPLRDGRGVHRLVPPYIILEDECDPNPPADEYLVTPVLDCTPYGAVYLHYRSEIVASDAALQEVLVSLDGGATFEPTPLFAYNAGGLFTAGEEPFYAARVLSVPNAAGEPSVAFAFHFQGPAAPPESHRFWALDDIKVTATRSCNAFMATFGGPSSGNVGETLHFTAATDATQPATYAWQVVSGSATIVGSSTADAVDVTSASPGASDVKLTVTDACGTSVMMTRTITFVQAGGGQIPGDCSKDGRLDISDAICLFGFLFQGTVLQLPCGDGLSSHAANKALIDWNNDTRIDISDGVSLLAFLFQGGPQHVLGRTCVRIADCPEECTP